MHLFLFFSQNIERIDDTVINSCIWMQFHLCMLCSITKIKMQLITLFCDITKVEFENRLKIFLILSSEAMKTNGHHHEYLLGIDPKEFNTPKRWLAGYKLYAEHKLFEWISDENVFLLCTKTVKPTILNWSHAQTSLTITFELIFCIQFWLHYNFYGGVDEVYLCFTFFKLIRNLKY